MRTKTTTAITAVKHEMQLQEFRAVSDGSVFTACRYDPAAMEV